MQEEKTQFGKSLKADIIYGTSGKLLLNTWHFVVATFDKDLGSNQMKIYVDGVLCGQRERTEPALTNSTNLCFGARADTFGDILPGSMDCVSIWDKALSEEEILTLYNGGGGTENLTSGEWFDYWVGK